MAEKAGKRAPLLFDELIHFSVVLVTEPVGGSVFKAFELSVIFLVADLFKSLQKALIVL